MAATYSQTVPKKWCVHMRARTLVYECACVHACVCEGGLVDSELTIGESGCTAVLCIIQSEILCREQDDSELRSRTGVPDLKAEYPPSTRARRTKAMPPDVDM